MTTTFVEFNRNYMLPTGGQAGTGEIIGIDSVLAATLIANGTAVSSSAPVPPTPPVMTRVKIVASFIVAGAPIYAAGVFVGVSPASFDAGDITGLPAALAAAMIANGQAVPN
jgi:hypothetical protein